MGGGGRRHGLTARLIRGLTPASGRRFRPFPPAWGPASGLGLPAFFRSRKRPPAGAVGRVQEVRRDASISEWDGLEEAFGTLVVISYLTGIVRQIRLLALSGALHARPATKRHL